MSQCICRDGLIQYSRTCFHSGNVLDIWTLSDRSMWVLQEILVAEQDCWNPRYISWCSSWNEGTLLMAHGGTCPCMSNNVQDVWHHPLDSPEKSLHWLSQRISMCKSTWDRAAKKPRFIHSYHVMAVHKLRQPDCDKHMTNFNGYKYFLMNTTESSISCGLWFHLSGYMKREKYQSVTAENPHMYHEELEKQHRALFCPR